MHYIVCAPVPLTHAVCSAPSESLRSGLEFRNRWRQNIPWRTLPLVRSSRNSIRLECILHPVMCKGKKINDCTRRIVKTETVNDFAPEFARVCRQDIVYCDVQTFNVTIFNILINALVIYYLSMSKAFIYFLFRLNRFYSQRGETRFNQKPLLLQKQKHTQWYRGRVSALRVWSHIAWRLHLGFFFFFARIIYRTSCAVTQIIIIIRARTTRYVTALYPVKRATVAVHAAALCAFFFKSKILLI